MGSAFTPVSPRSRGSSHMPPNDGLVKPISSSAGSSNSRRRPSKRTRQVSSLAQMAVAEEVDEEVQTLETVPDHLSTSASETSSKGSNSSQPPLLDFIGATCLASAWFTSCFPCAVVDINDNDNYVVDKLSRESAMNVMYANNASSKVVMPGASPTNERVSPVHRQRSDQERNMMFVQLPSSSPSQQQQEEHASRLNVGMSHPVPLHHIPSVIEEGSEDEEDNMDDIPLNDDKNVQGKSSSITADIAKPQILHRREDSGIVETRSPIVDRQACKNLAQPNARKVSKLSSVKKMFGRKKKA